MLDSSAKCQELLDVWLCRQEVYARKVRELTEKRE